MTSGWSELLQVSSHLTKDHSVATKDLFHTEHDWAFCEVKVEFIFITHLQQPTMSKVLYSRNKSANAEIYNNTKAVKNKYNRQIKQKQTVRSAQDNNHVPCCDQLTVS